LVSYFYFFFFSSRRRHTRFSRDWSSDVCSSDLTVHDAAKGPEGWKEVVEQHGEDRTANASEDVGREEPVRAMQILILLADPEQPEHVEGDVDHPPETRLQVQETIGDELPRLQQNPRQGRIQGQMLVNEQPGRSDMYEDEQPHDVRHDVDRQQRPERAGLNAIPLLESVHRNRSRHFGRSGRMLLGKPVTGCWLLALLSDPTSDICPPPSDICPPPSDFRPLTSNPAPPSSTNTSSSSAESAAFLASTGSARIRRSSPRDERNGPRPPAYRSPRQKASTLRTRSRATSP